jgi:ribonuclease I
MNRTYLFSKLREKYKDDSFFLFCQNYDDKTYLEELKFKLDMNFELTSEGKVNDNCPEEFYLEIIDEPLSKKDTNDDVWKTYDLYLLSILLPTTACKKIGYNCYNVMSTFPKNAWILHGLWPTYKNGSIPGWCHGDNDIEVGKKNNTLYNYMNTYWQSIYTSNERTWAHEYNRHGYCYNKKLELDVYDYDQYFMKSVELYKKYDLANIFINMFKNRDIKGDIKLNRTEIDNYFEKIGIKKDEYLLKCSDILIDGKNISYILEIRLIFDLNFSLYKNETDKTEKDCPFEFYAEFLE